MSTPGFVVLLAVLAGLGLLAAGWAGWTGSRLRRLERRVHRARERLVTELVRRRAVVAECVATERRLPAATGDLLLGLIARGRSADADRYDVEAAESALTRTLAAALASADCPVPPELERWRPALVVATRRVHFARRFHNDLVISLRALRAHRSVRWWWPPATGMSCLEQVDDPALLEHDASGVAESSGRSSTAELDQRRG